MNITNRTSFVGFLVALSALSIPDLAGAVTPTSDQAVHSSAPAQTIEARVSRLSVALRARAEQLPMTTSASTEDLIARGFADGAGRGWVDGARTGWVDGHGGDFVNRNGWSNGWGDGGGFANWRNY